jgi:RNA polymerase sigma-70 factor, ECF subfamily
MPRLSPAEATFARWLETARCGDREALGRVLDLCQSYLLLIARVELPDSLHGKVDPADVVQDTFLEAQRGFDTFHGATEQELLAWLRGILVYNLADLTRRFHRDKREVSRERSLDDSSNLGLQNELPDDDSTPSSKARSHERDEALDKALDQLPAHYRQVVEGRSVHGLSFDEIGRGLGKSAEAVRKLWVRAIEHLQRILQPYKDSR